MDMKKFIIFSQLHRCKRKLSNIKDFLSHTKELVTHLLHIGYPINVITKQCNKAIKMHLASLFTNGEKTIDNHISIVQTYHTTIVSTNKFVIKDWNLHSKINTSKHLFYTSAESAYRQLPNHKRMLVRSNQSRISSLVGNSKCMKPRCQVCDMFDTRQKI